ncbi:4'-phosphopantetheinyl transferase family protein [Kitasatospora sp. NPDC059795]|uniref:4'-phosphopantetheinyl transferase family protein n=1 Tax=Kitasatospora sp. NPDC059795 TaxID=3346949 RepID=UPI0036665C4B
MTAVWLIATDTGPEQACALAELLDPDERARAARTPDGPHRRRWIAAHAAARRLTAAAAGIPPEHVRWRRGPHGRPEPVGAAEELSVNLSTSGPWALFAVQPRACGEIGADLEPVPPDPAAARLALRYYPTGELDGAADEFTRRWTRKEAYTKAYGGRLADGLRTQVGPVDGPGPHRIDGPLGPCVVHDLPAPPGYRAAVARTGTRPILPRLLTYPADLAGEFALHLPPVASRPDPEG